MAPASRGRAYGSRDAYAKIDALPLPDPMQRFLKGSECVEAVRRGQEPEPPLPWLAHEPPRELIRVRGQRKQGWQTSADRHLCRWNLDWKVTDERIWS